VLGSRPGAGDSSRWRARRRGGVAQPSVGPLFVHLRLVSTLNLATTWKHKPEPGDAGRRAGAALLANGSCSFWLPGSGSRRLRPKPVGCRRPQAGRSGATPARVPAVDVLCPGLRRTAGVDPSAACAAAWPSTIPALSRSCCWRDSGRRLLYRSCCKQSWQTAISPVWLQPPARPKARQTSNSAASSLYAGGDIESPVLIDADVGAISRII